MNRHTRRCRILSAVRLPIPPRSQGFLKIINFFIITKIILLTMLLAVKEGRSRSGLLLVKIFLKKYRSIFIGFADRSLDKNKNLYIYGTLLSLRADKSLFFERSSFIIGNIMLYLRKKLCQKFKLKIYL